MQLDIMLPFWGKPEYLFSTVESVLQQDSDRWRLVVVDDQYPDERVPDYFRTLNHPRVEYHRNPINLGITDNYRKCLSLSRSDYMMFLGCDDILKPNYVSTILADIARYPGVDIIQPRVHPIDADGSLTFPLQDMVKRIVQPSVSRTPREIDGQVAAASLMTGDWLYWPSLTFKRQRLLETPFRDGFPLIQDLAIVVDILTSGGRLLLDPTECFHYRRHSTSASSSRILDGTRFQGERRYFTLAAQQFRAQGWKTAELHAKLHLTSRLYALTLLPAAIVDESRSRAVPVLLKHMFRTT